MYSAGRFADLLRELIYVGERPSTNHKDSQNDSGAPGSGDLPRAAETISILNAGGVKLVVEIPKTPDGGPTDSTASNRPLEQGTLQSTIDPSPDADGRDDPATSEQTRTAGQVAAAPASDSSSADSFPSPPTDFDTWFDLPIEKSPLQTGTLGADMDPFALWSALPAGNEPDEWISYIESLSTMQEL